VVISLRSQALANVQSRMTVPCETAKTSAASSILNPPYTRLADPQRRKEFFIIKKNFALALEVSYPLPACVGGANQEMHKAEDGLRKAETVF
jgi:hypothetical protein